MKRIFTAILVLLTFSFSGSSQITLTQFATGFSQPLDIKNCGDDRLFIVSQLGYIWIVDTNGVKLPTPFLDIHTDVLTSSEQGLLGLAFAPDYLTSGYFYLDYTSRPNGRTTIARFHVNATNPDIADTAREILLTIYQPYTNHNGGHLAFGVDGYLYIGMGDGGSGGDPENRAQNTDSLLGKILRISVDPSNPTYSIPPTNPFANNPSAGRGEIFTLGMRNPWRWSFDRLTHDLWIGDVGQNLVEEIDFIRAGTGAGLNLGWRCYEGNQSYNLVPGCGPYSSYFPPIRTYTHTGGLCSVTGGYIYRGAKYQALYGKYFYTDYCVSQIHYIVQTAPTTFVDTNLGLLGGAASIVTFGEDRWGELYCTAYAAGKVFRFSTSDCTPVATINGGRDTVIDCGAGSVPLSVPYRRNYTYSWNMNGVPVGTDTSEYIATQPGQYTITVTNDSNCTNTDTIVVNFVNPLVVTFNGLDTLYCVYNAQVFMNPLPIGGTFTGPGMSGIIFDPMQAGVGTHTITYSYQDNRGCGASYSLTTRVDACLGITEDTWLKRISLFPNPNTGDFILDIFAEKEKKLNLEIIDLLGRTIMHEEIAIAAGALKIPVSVGNIENGVYSVKLSDGNSSVVKMIIISK